MDDSTGLRSATKLSTPRTRCESRRSKPCGYPLHATQQTKKGVPSLLPEPLSIFETVHRENRNLRGLRRLHSAKPRFPLAAETRFEHANHGVLPSDDLSLPNQNDRHDAHRENTSCQNNTGLRFRSG